MTTWRNRVNMVAGWLIGYGLFLFVTYLDPLNVYSQHSPSQAQASVELETELVVVHLFFATLSVVGFALWAVPHVRTGRGVVRVVNPLTTWTLPVDCLQTLQEGVMFPRLTCGQSVIRLWGLERSVADTIRGHIVVPASEPNPDSAPAIKPSVSRSVQPALAILLLLWIGVTVAGLLASLA